MADGMLRWVQKHAGGYPGIGNNIKDFKGAFRSGLVWCAVLCSYDPACLDYASLKADTEQDMLRNHALAFETAEKRFGVEPLLDAEDMLHGPVPDHRSVLTYVSQMYKYMKPLEPAGNPYYREYERAEEALLRKRMEEAKAERDAARTPPPAQPIVRGQSLNSDDAAIPEGPCGKCQRDNNYPQCQGYEGSSFRKGKCVKCFHSAAEHEGGVADAQETPKPAAKVEEPIDEDRERRRRAHKEEMEREERAEAAKRGDAIEKSAQELVDFLTPKQIAKSDVMAAPTGPAPKGPCLKCRKEGAFPSCDAYDSSSFRKAQCARCFHPATDHAQEKEDSSSSGSAASDSNVASIPKRTEKKEPKEPKEQKPTSQLVAPSGAGFAVRKVYESLADVDTRWLRLKDYSSNEAEKVCSDLAQLRAKIEELSSKDDMADCVARFRELNRDVPAKVNEARSALNASAKSAAPTCAKCNGSISGRSADFEGASYHTRCFTCTKCSTSLSGQPQVLNVGGKPHCETCARVAVGGGSTSGSSASASSSSSGDFSRQQAQRRKARAERRKEILAEGLKAGIIPAPREDLGAKLKQLRKGMAQRKAQRVHVPEEADPVASTSVTSTTTAKDDDRQAAREREEEEQRRRKRQEEEEEERRRDERRRQREQEEKDEADRVRRKKEEEEEEQRREERRRRRKEEEEEEERRRKEQEAKRQQEDEETRRLEEAAEERRKRRESRAAEEAARERAEEEERERRAEERRLRREREEEEERKNKEEQQRKREEEEQRRKKEEEEERRKKQEEEDARRKERESRAAATATEESSRASRASRAAPASSSDEPETTVDLTETDPEKLLAALEAKPESQLSSQEQRAKRRAAAAVQRKKEEEQFEREMEERRRAREERRRQREAGNDN